MRCLYRETIYQAGDYMDVSIFPVYKKSGQRSRKAKPTSEVQQKLNMINSKNNLIRICNANFTDRDFEVTLTYRPECFPEDDESAMKELRNFLRRFKNYRSRNGLEDLKYVAVTEKGKRSGKYHHHLIVNGGFEPRDIVKLWGLGIVQFKSLQFDNEGIAALVGYITKDPIGTKKRWTSSKNLVHPKPIMRNGRITKRIALELAKDTTNSANYEKLYPDYFFSSANKLINDFNGGVYVHARFYRKELAKKCGMLRKRPKA